MTYHFTRNASGVTFEDDPDDDDVLFAKATTQILKTDIGLIERRIDSDVLKSELTNIQEVTEMESPTAASSNNLATENFLDEEEPQNLLVLEAVNNDENLEPVNFDKVRISSNMLFKTIDANLKG